jgi:hypothetical protein
MDWIRQIINYNELPQNKIWVSIQNGRADHYRNHSAFAKRDIVLVFDKLELADYFISHWDRRSMNDYKEACLPGEYTFWVIQPCNRGYYADDIIIRNLKNKSI